MGASRSAIPTYQLREIAESKGMNSHSELTPENFVTLYIEDKRREAMDNPGFKKGLSRVCSRKYIKNYKQTDKEKLHNKVAEHKEDNALKSVHTYSVDEVRGFSSWINTQLKNHSKINQNSNRIPIDESNPQDFFAKLGDG